MSIKSSLRYFLKSYSFLINNSPVSTFPIDNHLSILSKRIKSRKSQVLWEYIILISLALILFATFGYIIVSYYSDYNQRQVEKDSVIVLSSIREQVETAYRVHNGYFSKLRIPNFIDGYNYSLNYSNGIVELKIQSLKKSITISIPSVIGQFNVNKYNIFLMKKDGLVYLN